MLFLYMRVYVLIAGNFYSAFCIHQKLGHFMSCKIKCEFHPYSFQQKEVSFNKVCLVCLFYSHTYQCLLKGIHSYLYYYLFFKDPFHLLFTKLGSTGKCLFLPAFRGKHTDPKC